MLEIMFICGVLYDFFGLYFFRESLQVDGLVKGFFCFNLFDYFRFQQIYDFLFDKVLIVKGEVFVILVFGFRNKVFIFQLRKLFYNNFCLGM